MVVNVQKNVIPLARTKPGDAAKAAIATAIKALEIAHEVVRDDTLIDRIAEHSLLAAIGMTRAAHAHVRLSVKSWDPPDPRTHKPGDNGDH